MSASLDGKLVVAISSRALFDFEEENEVFEQGDDRAYMALQLERLEIPAKPGVAFSLVKKLLAFNQAPPSPQPSPKGSGSEQPVEVVILSRNDPVSGLRVMKSAAHYDLPIIRCSFTRGESPWRYLKPLHANLFLSTHLSDVRAALDAGVPAAQVYPQSAHAGDAYPHARDRIVARQDHHFHRLGRRLGRRFGRGMVEGQQLPDQRKRHARLGRNFQPLQLQCHVGAVVALLEDFVFLLEIKQGAA